LETLSIDLRLTDVQIWTTGVMFNAPFRMIGASSYSLHSRRWAG